MCRNIKTLHNFRPPATEEEIRASSLQFVRKLSGFTRPSKANQIAFERAVDQVTKAASELLSSLVTNAPPAIEKSRRRKRGQERRTGSAHPMLDAPTSQPRAGQRGNRVVAVNFLSAPGTLAAQPDCRSRVRREDRTRVRGVCTRRETSRDRRREGFAR